MSTAVNGDSGSSHSRAASSSSITDPSPIVNGINANGDGPHESESNDADTMDSLRAELDKTKEEKDALATQYNSLLTKLTDMRTRLGAKLKQDAEELDRRESLIQSLTEQNDDLNSSLLSLQSELESSHTSISALKSEVSSLRTRSLQSDASQRETLIRERELREAQLELERCRVERDEWERMALQEKAMNEEVRAAQEEIRRELDMEREARARTGELLDAEREKSANLQSVLLDFQGAKDHELQQAIKDYEQQVMQVTQSLAEYKHRAHTAEMKLEESNTDVTRTQELEKELKEKNLLIGKLRHEGVIMNEHLVEALRRLRKNSSETNVDRRLVTNIILSFITTPRGDTKRFEMLNLLSSILSWGDAERERAGLQKQQTSGGGGGGGVLSPPAATGFWGRSLSSGGQSASVFKTPDIAKSDETESFSRLWVEFLLTEASGDSSNPPPPKSPPGNGSLPSSPTTATHSLSPPSGPRRTLNSSSPNLAAMGEGKSRKGKEREVLGVSPPPP
ncbi:hypothetical protein BKA70DRAFT_1456482 [Coprinopsis sp. MPI-PUGE-AT-0042]|nr:hypothetical protein BKA70DRAFT_1456482 [Coprinopsis sp. MPI-PUGE-AT-0042]